MTVTEAGIRPWSGAVLSVKPSPASGWWVDVQRDGGGWYVVPARVVVLERVGVLEALDRRIASREG